jgi:hypothetical protein
MAAFTAGADVGGGDAGRWTAFSVVGFMVIHSLLITGPSRNWREAGCFAGLWIPLDSVYDHPIVAVIKGIKIRPPS